MARLWRAFSFSTKHFQGLRENPFVPNELETFRRELQTASKNSTAQKWHKAAQKFGLKFCFVHVAEQPFRYSGFPLDWGSAALLHSRPRHVVPCVGEKF
jgi:hypothetical protein